MWDSISHKAQKYLPPHQQHRQITYNLKIRWYFSNNQRPSIKKLKPWNETKLKREHPSQVTDYATTKGKINSEQTR